VATFTSIEITRGPYAQEAKLYEANTDSGDHYFAMRPPAAGTGLTANQRWVVPTSPGTAGKVLQVSSVSGDNSTLTWYSVVERVGAAFDGGGSAIAANKVAYTYIPFAGTITKWTVLCDQNVSTSGIDFYIYKDAYSADTLPTTDITGTGTRPNVASGSHKTGQGSTFTDWTTTTVTAGDMLGIKVKTAPTSATWCSVTLDVTR
jgi:hypothetical protein